MINYPPYRVEKVRGYGQIQLILTYQPYLLQPISQRFKASTLSKPEKTEVFIQQAKQALKGMADKPIEGVI